SIGVYATQTNWKDEILRTQAVGSKGPGWKARYTQIKEENAALQHERDDLELKLNAERAAKTQALAKAEAEINRLKKDYAAADADRKAKDEQLVTSNNALKVAQDNLSEKTAESTKLRDENATLIRDNDEQVKKAISLADKLAIASGQLSVLKERNDQL